MKSQSGSRQHRRIFQWLLLILSVFTFLLICLFIFQYIKHLLYPQITLWQSNVITNVAFAAISAVVMGGYIYDQKKLLRKVRCENSRRKRVQDKLKVAYQHLTVERRKLEEVLSLEERINKITSESRLIQFVLRKIESIFKARQCFILLVDSGAERFCLRGHLGLSEKQLLQYRKMRLCQTILSYVVEKREPILIESEADERILSDQNWERDIPKPFISTPILSGQNVLGVIVICKGDQNEFRLTAVDVKVLSLIASQIAMALENSKLYQQTVFLTMTDQLTEMKNYRCFTVRLENEILRSNRYPSPFSLLMLDIDNLKGYNDALGHRAGDLLLREIARVILENIRGVDIACRYAGDEFAIILPHTNVINARNIAVKLQSKIAHLKRAHPVSVSIGIVSYRTKMSRYELVQKAGMALLEAKRQGKDSLICY